MRKRDDDQRKKTKEEERKRKKEDKISCFTMDARATKPPLPVQHIRVQEPIMHEVNIRQT